MTDIYATCPTLENARFQLRQLRAEDAGDLLAVYSDKAALPYFNSDNCHGDIFYYPTPERMAQAVQFWLDSYANRWFVRWAIIDRAADRAIGTIEGFRRGADGHFGDVGVLRVDVGSAYENTDDLAGVLALIVPPSFDGFDCDEIITKSPAYAVDRVAALQRLGFTPAQHTLVGEGGREYGDYWSVHR